MQTPVIATLKVRDGEKKSALHELKTTFSLSLLPNVFLYYTSLIYLLLKIIFGFVSVGIGDNRVWFCKSLSFLCQEGDCQDVDVKSNQKKENKIMK